MSSADDYREYARECMASAANAKNEAEQQLFLQMAQTWARAALALAHGSGEHGYSDQGRSDQGRSDHVRSNFSTND